MKLLSLLFLVLTLSSLAAEEEEQELTVQVDILIKPERSITGKGVHRVYPPSSEIQRFVLEPWSKFYYRIQRTHCLGGQEASKVLEFLNAQIANTNPTGWVGHEAEYCVTVMEGEEVKLRVTLSSESQSSVYMDGDGPNIGHFAQNPEVIGLLKD